MPNNRFEADAVRRRWRFAAGFAARAAQPERSGFNCRIDKATGQVLEMHVTK